MLRYKCVNPLGEIYQYQYDNNNTFGERERDLMNIMTDIDDLDDWKWARSKYRDNFWLCDGIVYGIFKVTHGNTTVAYVYRPAFRPIAISIDGNLIIHSGWNDRDDYYGTMRLLLKQMRDYERGETQVAHIFSDYSTGNLKNLNETRKPDWLELIDDEWHLHNSLPNC